MWWLSRPQDLHRIEDRLSTVYVERCHIDRDDNAVVMVNKQRTVRLPAALVATVLIGPGTRITHGAGAPARRLRNGRVLGRGARSADVRHRPRPQPWRGAADRAGVPGDPNQGTPGRRSAHVRDALPGRGRP